MYTQVTNPISLLNGLLKFFSTRADGGEYYTHVMDMADRILDQ
jgi:hypothetical protein